MMRVCNYIAIAIATSCLASCASDEVLDERRDEIRFAVAAEKASRGEVITNDNVTDEDLNVWAFYRENETAAVGSGVLYMHEMLSYNTTNGWRTENQRYWPAGWLDFYSLYPTSIEFDSNTKTFNYSVASNIAAQDDVLYALSVGKTETYDPVRLNMRHALSQIVFNVAASSKYKVRAVVDEIVICNLYSKGKFTMPTVDTHDNYNYSNIDPDNQDTELGESWGKWSERDVLCNYVVTPAQPVVVNSINADVADDKLPFSGLAQDNHLLLLPQTGIPYVSDDGVRSGTYFKVLCHVDVTAADGRTFVQVWPKDANNTGSEYIYVAAPVAWKQGIKYIYTFIFGENGNAEDENGDPVYVPIKFRVTVDYFQTAGEQDVNMKL